MERPWHVWSIFAGCLAMAALALGWLTYRALQLDWAEAVARAQMAVEENARLALWRMDSAMATLVARESTRPWFAYRGGTAVGLAGGAKNQAGGAANPSLIEPRSALVQLYFEIDAAGRITTPQQAPAHQASQEIAEDGADNPMALCRQLQQQIDLPVILTTLPAPEVHDGWPPHVVTDAQPAQLPDVALQQEYAASPDEQVQIQQARNRTEYRARAQYFSANAGKTLANAAPKVGALIAETSPVMTPMWAGQNLLLLRKVKLNNEVFIQGCWLDLPAIETTLIESVRDLLPYAVLQPVRGPAAEQAHLLASLPLNLLPGELPGQAASSLSPMKLALLLAWVAFAVAALAVALLLSGVVALSERRASFVSAVTHELRTPLTTFRLYSEMLAEGMVPDEQARHSYLTTLRSEADRLMHLVENVLAYARLEKGRLDGRIVPVTIDNLLECSLPHLATRCQQVGLNLEVSLPPEIRAAQVLADATAVDQILFNLVDNACKYAASGGNRELQITAHAAGRHIALRVQDQGPGISPQDRAKLFRPFHKTAHEAAVTAPGVGLGLALSRRLARTLGGDLLCTPCDQGCQFSLLLCRASR